MSIVTNKYTPAEMSSQELEATFAAREHTVDYLLKSLRDQIHSRTLSSHVITGPRGAGKSTIIQMVALRIRQDTELRGAWIPLVFPEEQFEMVSLRDMLAAILRALGKEKISQAQDWLEKVEADPNEEQSQQLAITALKEITRQTGKRLILFIENLDQLLGRNLDDHMKGTLRRLLMTDPFMMIIGSTVHIFDSLKNYDEAFFNYFDPVPLGRLDSKQVSELLRKRAQFDNNERFLKELPQQQAKVQTLVHLTGGNPRFVLMLYELLSLQKVTTIVQYLRRLIDELTPLLKHEMENLPPQQQKIVHALMEKGGTAQPSDLVGPTRLPLNAVTTQLKRLKDAQIVEVLGGGKGRSAHYTVPDKLFSIWYQMRYLSQNRRRIEMFVEVLRIWFEEEERVQTLRNLTTDDRANVPQLLRECAATAEYFAASLKGTKHELVATDLCVTSWLKADIKEAAFAYVDLVGENATISYDETFARTELATWCSEHEEPQRAIEILDQILAGAEVDVITRAFTLVRRGNIKAHLHDAEGAIADTSLVISMSNVSQNVLGLAYTIRATARDCVGDKKGAIADFSSAIQSSEVSSGILAMALMGRGTLNEELGHVEAAHKDFSDLIAIDGLSSQMVSEALIERGITKGTLKDYPGAIADFTAVGEMKDTTEDVIARALVNRGATKAKSHDMQGAIEDYTKVINSISMSEGVARALINRGGIRLKEGNLDSALCDFTAVVTMPNVPSEQLADALYRRGIYYNALGSSKMAAEDWIAAMDASIKAKTFLPGFGGTAFYYLWLCGDQMSAMKILKSLSGVLNGLRKDRASEAVVRFLSSLTSPEMKIAWSNAWQHFLTNLKPDVVEIIRIFEPVALVLEGEDRKLLDTLPPEHREFALKVLEKFTSQTEPSQPAKTKYPKKTSSKGST